MQKLEKILEELNRRINEYVDHDYVRGSGDVVKGLSIAKSIIRKHMSGKDTDVPTNDGWIPVEERLPIPNKEIWVTAKRNGNVFTSTDTMTEKGYFWNYEKENILAWKEKELIPEPYRPERSEK